jgi:hypothetical protein
VPQPTRKGTIRRASPEKEDGASVNRRFFVLPCPSHSLDSQARRRWLFCCERSQIRAGKRESTGKVKEVNMDINTFSDPSEYMSAARKNGVAVSTTFGWAVSQTMMNRGLTFPEAVKLLEVAGVLLWSGDCPVIYMKRHEFWMRKPHEASELQEE